MTIPYPDLFPWWAISISWSSVFLTAVSIYLYADSRKRRQTSRTTTSRFGLIKDFVFVWVLLGLLTLYIVSINRSASTVFAGGNIVVEAILIVYLMKNRSEKAEPTSPPRSV